MNTIEILKNKTPEELIELVNSLESSVNILEQQVQQRDTFIETLQQELALAKHRHFGRKSEKYADDAVQHNLFDEAQTPDNVAEIETTDEEITVTYQRKKSGRKSLPKHLPRVQVIHDLLDEEKMCICGCEMTRIGEDKSEQLDIIPAKIQIIEHIKCKYACKGCAASIKTAKAAAQPIPKSIASPGLLAYVATAKFCDHLPLYRQENIFRRMNVDIARNTLAHWVIKSSILLRPLYHCLLHEINADTIAYADETRVQVLKEKDRPAEANSFMWCFIGGAPPRRSVIYHYNRSRAHTVIEELLPDFSGYLHCDGYGGYDAYAGDHNVTLAACWMHCRRKFYEVAKLVKSPGLADKAVKLIAKLYKVEKSIKALGLSPDAIKAYRLEQAKPVLDKIRKFITDNQSKILPKSPLGKAFAYADNQWHKLIVYLEEGRLEIDNGLAERAIKPFVIGRKNYLFCDSVPGAQAAEIFYSLIETCKLHQVEPYAYLRTVLTKLPAMTTLEEMDPLLPFNFKLEHS